jgi:TetR/AcrR family transcriptional regulator
MATTKKIDRKQNILEVLARELETNPGSRITTAALAKAVGVSEAALYRHFASKAKMYEALIDFAEDSVFGLINKILEQEKTVEKRCERILMLVLGFAERNPGIARVLLGDALVGENERLRIRVAKFFERIETQLKQILREANLSGGSRASQSIDATANLLMIIIEGHVSEYIRSEFEKKPTANLDQQWVLLKESMFK